MTTSAPQRQRRGLNPEALRERRTALGLTQEQLAEKARTTQAHVSHWELGHWGCDALALLGLAEALECEPAELLAA